MNDGTKNTTPNSAMSAFDRLFGSLFIIDAMAFANTFESVINDMPAITKRASPISPNTSDATRKGLFFTENSPLTLIRVRLS